MVRDDLIGELSARLERLQAATPVPVSELADLRCQVEASPVTWLAAEVAFRAGPSRPPVPGFAVSGRHRRIRPPGTRPRRPAPVRCLRSPDR
jgi:hypothetical protein